MRGSQRSAGWRNAECMKIPQNWTGIAVVAAGTFIVLNVVDELAIRQGYDWRTMIPGGAA